MTKAPIAHAAKARRTEPNGLCGVGREGPRDPKGRGRVCGRVGVFKLIGVDEALQRKEGEAGEWVGAE